MKKYIYLLLFIFFLGCKTSDYSKKEKKIKNDEKNISSRLDEFYFKQSDILKIEMTRGHGKTARSNFRQSSADKGLMQKEWELSINLTNKEKIKFAESKINTETNTKIIYDKP